MNKIKILIAAGGTGGHLYPAIALADELKNNNCEIMFVIRKNDLAIKILKQKNLPFTEITASGLPRKSLIKLFSFTMDLISGIISSTRLIKSIKPDIVVGMGGYISFPAILCARLLQIPTIIHEQNFLPGMANRVLSKFTNRVAVSFEETRKRFPVNKTFLSGNPVRKEIISGKKNYQRFNLANNKFTVFVFGGSQGSIAINTAVLNALDCLNEIKEKIQFIHATGEKNFDTIKNAYIKKNITACVEPYISDIETAYATSDLVICRAGATTIAELKILQIPAIFIPYPHATDNHQFYNAKHYLDSGGVGKIIEENQLTPEGLAQEIKFYYNNTAPKSKTIDEILPQKKLAEEIIKLAKTSRTVPAASGHRP